MEKSKEKNMKITRNWINVTKYFNKGIDNDKNIKKRWPHTKKQTEITKRQKYAKKTIRETKTNHRETESETPKWNVQKG